MSFYARRIQRDFMLRKCTRFKLIHCYIQQYICALCTPTDIMLHCIASVVLDVTHYKPSNFQICYRYIQTCVNLLDKILRGIQFLEIYFNSLLRNKYANRLSGSWLNIVIIRRINWQTMNICACKSNLQ